MPAFPTASAAKKLLARMSAQARRYSSQFVKGHIDTIDGDFGRFHARGDGIALEASTIIIATGTVNRRPDVDPATHRSALDNGRLRYCPVCDGFEATDQTIGVIGGDARGVTEALFLRTYSKDVTLLAVDSMDVSADDRLMLEHSGIRIEERPLARLVFNEEHVSALLKEGGERRFDTVYPALGSDSNDGLAHALGLDMADGCCIAVDRKQRTSREGIYAAGDIVYALDQISVAMGHAAIAATTLHNDLRAREGRKHRRQN